MDLRLVGFTHSGRWPALRHTCGKTGRTAREHPLEPRPRGAGQRCGRFSWSGDFDYRVLRFVFRRLALADFDFRLARLVAM